MLDIDLPWLLVPFGMLYRVVRGSGFAGPPINEPGFLRIEEDVNGLLLTDDGDRGALRVS